MAGPDLESFRERFDEFGMMPGYGGRHSNGNTHIDILGFRDGSYVELLAPVDEEATPPIWDKFARLGGGPCGWAIRVADVASTVRRFKNADVPIDGPAEYSRTQPDGTVAKWTCVFPGDGEPGAVLPFLISDRTPRERRTTLTENVAESELVGVGRVVLCVSAPEVAIRLFRDVFDLPRPDRDRPSDLAADLYHFPGTPVILAAPTTDESWLARRLDTFGPAPCGVLFQTTDLDRSGERFSGASRHDWFDCEIAVTTIEVPYPSLLGAIEEG